VERSLQEGMAALEELPRFESDHILEGALPQGVRCVHLRQRRCLHRSWEWAKVPGLKK
jgi:hypothetical protein